MIFVDRREEMARLERLMASREGGLAVLHGRRRLGKTRLLLEWSSRHAGLYAVADQSAAEIQRRYFADCVSQRIAGFGDVEYRDWNGLLVRLAREASALAWRGPIIFDELPYLVASSPELPSVLQRWIDHDARASRLVIAVAGSSQRMMQGLVLSKDAPLYGRARELLEVRPLDAAHLTDVFARPDPAELVGLYAAWGGVPRYWELAVDLEGDARSQVEHLVLDPLGPLHREPDRLLLEDIPPAVEVRPILDAIGAGAHRVSEIAGRIGRPPTSMARPLERLVGMGLVRREIPFGEPERKSRKSLYVIDDAFFRLWFRVVAPHRGPLAAATRRGRLALLKRYWNDLVSRAWEDLCRLRLPRLADETPLGRLGPWLPASRWWSGTAAEWDIVSESESGGTLLLAEAKWSAQPFGGVPLARVRAELHAKPPPPLPRRYSGHRVVRAIFVPAVERSRPTREDEPLIVSCADLLQG
ncbi:MAG: ATP-binding protein [Candidatus Binatia bacterium]